MNVSSKCYYALRAIYALAEHTDAKPMKIGDIAEREKIPPRFLESILNQLKGGGFVQSWRGGGGIPTGAAGRRDHPRRSPPVRRRADRAGRLREPVTTQGMRVPRGVSLLRLLGRSPRGHLRDRRHQDLRRPHPGKPESTPELHRRLDHLRPLARECIRLPTSGSSSRRRPSSSERAWWAMPTLQRSATERSCGVPSDAMGSDSIVPAPPPSRNARARVRAALRCARKSAGLAGVGEPVTRHDGSHSRSRDRGMGAHRADADPGDDSGARDQRQQRTWPLPRAGATDRRHRERGESNREPGRRFLPVRDPRGRPVRRPRGDAATLRADHAHLREHAAARVVRHRSSDRPAVYLVILELQDRQQRPRERTGGAPVLVNRRAIGAVALRIADQYHVRADRSQPGPERSLRANRAGVDREHRPRDQGQSSQRES